MKRIQLTQPHDFRLASVPEPQPRDGEATVRITSMGICATDLALINGTNAVSHYPTFVGHEAVGVVEAAPASSGFHPGDCVAIFPTLSCAECSACCSGHENQCTQMTVMGLSDQNGLFSEVVAVPVGQLVAMNADAARDFGALVEPLAVGVHIANRAQLDAGDRMVILGAGVIGIVTAMVARHLGVETVALIDREASRQELLSPMGFEDLIVADFDAQIPSADVDVGLRPDVILDTIVTNHSARFSLSRLRSGGRYLPVASASPKQELCLPYADLYGHELSVIACRNYTRGAFERAVQLLESGELDPRPIITKTWRLDDFPEAVGQLMNDETALKFMMRP